MKTLTDMALVTQTALLGNKRAFDQLVRRHQSAVRRFLLHLTLGNTALSDDLAQETFIRAYTHIGHFKALASFQTWLFRIAYRAYYDYQRSRQRQPGLATDGGEATLAVAATMATPTTETMLSLDLLNALALLSDLERTCITLQLIDGEPIARIAEITGLGENTVKSHLHRGKKRMAHYLRQNGYDR